MIPPCERKEALERRFWARILFGIVLASAVGLALVVIPRRSISGLALLGILLGLLWMLSGIAFGRR